MKTRLVWITPDAENVVSYCARVSNPKNQENYKTAPGLLKYCMDEGHWSVFEMASACFEIETSRAIAPQILRHRSFSFQEFSQRYADATQFDFELINPRRQDTFNRQNSFDDLDIETKKWFQNLLEAVHQAAYEDYEEALKRGIAKESARFMLPLSTTTRLYMSGTLRSWIHYIKLRTHPSTQLEHREIALSIKAELVKQCPIIFGAI